MRGHMLTSMQTHTHRDACMVRQAGGNACNHAVTHTDRMYGQAGRQANMQTYALTDMTVTPRHGIAVSAGR